MNPKNIKRSIEIARALQYKRSGKSFHATVIWAKNRVASIGINTYGKTHPLIPKFDYKNDGNFSSGIHSELAAFIKLGEENCGHYSFVNIRLNSNGELRNSKPCPGCSHLLRQIGYREFYFSTDTEFVNLTSPQSTITL